MSTEFHVSATRYQMVEASDVGALADLVDEELASGWTLYGNPMCAPSHPGYFRWSQALIRTD